MADDGKTEKPTPRKVRKARKEGQFARTQDAATWLGIAAGISLLPRSVALLVQDVRDLLALLPVVAQDPRPERLLELVSRLPQLILIAVAPVCLAAVAGGVLATAVQGVHLTGSTLTPKFSRLNPIPGIKRMVGPQAAWEAVKAVSKVAVIATVVFALARSLIPELLAGSMPLAVVVDRTYAGLTTLLWAAALTGLLLALADYAYQRRRTMKQLRMTPREIKDEMRQSEGDPQIKGAIRSRQLAMSRNRMLSAVAAADVVLVNPTHYAVALAYDPIKGAPRVVAKGAGALALKIRERARDAKVPVVEDKPLTRTLYRLCELDDEIPAELYLAVARVLAFVMAARRPGRAAPPRRPTPSSGLAGLPTKAELRQRRSREKRDARKAQRV